MGFLDKIKGSSNNFKYLDDLIHSGEKEIVLDSDITYNSEEDSGSIKLDVDELTIDGNGHTINAKGKTRIFCVEKDCHVIIKNITLKNASDGAIKNNGKLLVENSTFKSNEGGRGGAISNACILNVINSTFKNNKARYDGGAIGLSNYGGFYHGSRYPYASFQDCTFSNNKAKSHGGAISADKQEQKLILKDTTFTGNKAKYGNSLSVHMHNWSEENCNTRHKDIEISRNFH